MNFYWLSMRKIEIPARSNETDAQIDKKLKDRFAILEAMTQAAIESKQLNKMTGETLFKKLNGNKRFLILSHTLLQ